MNEYISKTLLSKKPIFIFLQILKSYNYFLNKNIYDTYSDENCRWIKCPKSLKKT